MESPEIAYFTIKTFCAHVGICHREYYYQQANGKGPRVTRHGRKVMISRGAAKEWLEGRESMTETKGAAAPQQPKASVSALISTPRPALALVPGPPRSSVATVGPDSQERQRFTGRGARPGFRGIGGGLNRRRIF